ncbi:phage portal protein [Pinisolibacter sp.]|uniref:phage portal protein n=1 Tax=Pinisolibacter sp. TaxID=2172024 RepID=UPI002FDE6C70
MFKLFNRQTKTDTSIAETKATTSTLASPQPWLFDLFDAAPASSGELISPRNAERVPAVRRAVGALAEGVSGLPCVVYQTGVSGAVSAITDHPLSDLLGITANDWTPAAAFYEQMTRDAVLTGNAHAWIARNGDGEPVELTRLRPGDMTCDADVNPLDPPIYRLQGMVVDRSNVLHIRAPSLDGVSGVSPVVACREALGLALAIEKHVARLFGRGARPSGILSFPGRLGAEVAARVKASWQAAHSGSNSGGTAVLEENARFESLTMTSVDAQLLELWKQSAIEVARIFGVPPHLIFELDRATWGNAAAMGETFLRFGLSRWLRAWEGELNLKLIAPEDRRRLTIEFDTDALTRTDLSARADAYSTLISARVLTPNEARAREGLPPKDGGDDLVNPFTTSAKAPTMGGLTSG